MSVSVRRQVVKVGEMNVAYCGHYHHRQAGLKVFVTVGRNVVDVREKDVVGYMVRNISATQSGEGAVRRYEHDGNQN
tara:strand:- start:74 stop:304 length:231 start_codon:yes stop_codon:yes gene_type:complete